MLNTLNQANDGSYLFSGTDISNPAIDTAPPYTLNPELRLSRNQGGTVIQYTFAGNLTITDTIGSSTFLPDEQCDSKSWS
ncbi:hypothetical protein OH492_12735 [Vibrio chagasii]|nr:hypothetical protein [Vibrio chagasii]